MTKHISKTNYAAPHSDSLRCTIPKEVCTELNINKGDSIVWSIEKDNNGATQVTIKKLDL